MKRGQLMVSMVAPMKKRKKKTTNSDKNNSAEKIYTEKHEDRNQPQALGPPPAIPEANTATAAPDLPFDEVFTQSPSSRPPPAIPEANTATAAPDLPFDEVFTQSPSSRPPPAIPEANTATAAPDLPFDEVFTQSPSSRPPPAIPEANTATAAPDLPFDEVFTQSPSSRPPPAIPEANTATAAPDLPFDEVFTQSPSSRPPPAIPEENTATAAPDLPFDEVFTQSPSSRPPPAIPEANTATAAPDLPFDEVFTQSPSSRPPPAIPEANTATAAPDLPFDEVFTQSPSSRPPPAIPEANTATAAPDLPFDEVFTQSPSSRPPPAIPEANTATAAPDLPFDEVFTQSPSSRLPPAIPEANTATAAPDLPFDEVFTQPPSSRPPPAIPEANTDTAAPDLPFDDAFTQSPSSRPPPAVPEANTATAAPDLPFDEVFTQPPFLRPALAVPEENTATAAPDLPFDEIFTQPPSSRPPPAVPEATASTVASNLPYAELTTQSLILIPPPSSTAAKTATVSTNLSYRELQRESSEMGFISDFNDLGKGCDPSSVPLPYSPNIEESHVAPRSAPLPIRTDEDFALLNSLEMTSYNEQKNLHSSSSSPVRSFNISDFHDSSSSWIPDSDEDPQYFYHNNVRVSESSSCEDSSVIDGHEHTAQIIKKRKKYSPKKKRSPKRWKKANPLKWKRNIEIQKKRSGVVYKNKEGKEMAPKIPKPANCTLSCRFKCTEAFTEEDRKCICRNYWQIVGYNYQKDFLLKHVIQKPIKRALQNIPENKRRKSSREYYFVKNENNIRVCKDFFMKTLCISNGPIDKALAGKNEYGSFEGKDCRGSFDPVNKTSQVDINYVKEHINSFPTMESHYCRHNTKRLYLDSYLSIAKMYEDYKISATKEIQRKGSTIEGHEPVSMAVYKRIFGSDFNLSFFHPKKDQCAICNRYTNSGKPESQKEEYEEHIARKVSANSAKEADKKKCNEDPAFMSVTLDLQSVLQIPSGDIGPLYYSRKINVHNLTIYEAKEPNNAFCLLWNELNGKRGSVEIATGIYWWICQLSKEVKEVSIFSDTCSGQNRNQYIAAFFLYIVQSTDLEVIEQKYLESGHSYMEVDSMHSAIEKEKRYTQVFSMIDWKNIMKKARSKRHRKNAEPYNVVELKYEDMLDVKVLNERIIQNRCTDENGNSVKWLKIKCLRFEKNNPGIIKFRYDHIGPYINLNTRQLQQKKSVNKGTVETRATRGKKRDMPRLEEDRWEASCFDMPMPKAYKNILPISKAKKRDLVALCKKGVIPSELHPWFNSLPDNAEVVDRLPEPDGIHENDENGEFSD